MVVRAAGIIEPPWYMVVRAAGKIEPHRYMVVRAAGKIVSGIIGFSKSERKWIFGVTLYL